MKRTILLTFASAFSPIAQAYDMEDVKRIEFEVRDPVSKEVFFRGVEDITQEGSSIHKETRYFDPQKVEVQYENVFYDKASLRVQSYRFRNPITGEETDLETRNEQMAISYRAGAEAATKTGTMTWEKDAYHGKVFNNLILRHWATLLQGQPLTFDLLLPYRFESIGFRITHKNSLRVDGEDREVFALEPTSFIIRAIAPKMEFHYTKGEKPRIRQFSGPCTIPINGKRDRIMDIIFNYPGL